MTGTYLRYSAMALLAAVLAFMPTLSAQADGGPEADNPAYLSASVGYFDILDDEDAASFRAEYRFGRGFIYDIKPFLAADVTSDGSYFLGGGVYRDFFLNDSVYFTPSFGVNYYEDGGSELDLGHEIEFRSQIEIGYEFDSADRISVGFSHYSNASLDEDNPGVEVLSLYYHFPIPQ